MLVLSHIYKSYRSGKRDITVLDDLSLHLDKGKTVFLFGRSGSGKSTVLNCASGLQKPDSGSVICDQTELTELCSKKIAGFIREKTGYMFQSGNLVSFLNVYENVSFPLNLNGYSHKKLKKRVTELLTQVGLREASLALPGELSGGERKKIAFLRAIAHKPRVLFIDEPTANLDSASADNLMSMIQEISAIEKISILIATHDQGISSYADLIYSLNNGKLCRC